MTDFWRHLDAWWNLYSVCSHLYTQLYTEREREADGRRRRREREGGRKEFLAISSQRPPECLHPPKSICWIPYPKSNGIWRRGPWEVTGFIWSQGGGALTMGMLLPAWSLPTTWRCSKWMQSRKRAFTKNLTMLVSWSQTSSLQNWDEKSWLLKLPHLWYSLRAAWAD